MKDDKALLAFEDRIAEMLRAAEASGELRSARDWGKPLDFGDGYDDTPAELRMAFRILKGAGYAPPEIELFNEAARLRTALATLDAGSAEAAALRGRINDVELKLGLRVERLASRSL